MTGLWRIVKRRWIVSTFAVAALIVSGNLGWRAWQRAAIQRSLIMRIDRAWIDRSGLVHLEARCRFDRSSLPVWYRIGCPRSLDFDPSFGGFSYHIESSPAQQEVRVKGKPREGEIRTISCDEWQKIEYRSLWDNDLFNLKVNDSDTLPFEMRVRSTFWCCPLTHQKLQYLDQMQKYYRWLTSLAPLPPQLRARISAFCSPQSEHFSIDAPSLTLDPTKRNFDFITARPIAPESIK